MFTNVSNQEVGAMLRYYNKKYVAALQDCFPEVQFDLSKFANVPSM